MSIRGSDGSLIESHRADTLRPDRGRLLPQTARFLPLPDPLRDLPQLSRSCFGFDNDCLDPATAATVHKNIFDDPKHRRFGMAGERPSQRRCARRISAWHLSARPRRKPFAGTDAAHAASKVITLFNQPQNRQSRPMKTNIATALYDRFHEGGSGGQSGEIQDRHQTQS